MHQLLLYEGDRGALDAQFGGADVPQTEGVDALVDACLAGEAGQHCTHIASLQWAAGQHAEDVNRQAQPLLTPQIRPAFDQSKGRRVHAHHAARSDQHLRVFVPSDTPSA